MRGHLRRLAIVLYHGAPLRIQKPGNQNLIAPRHSGRHANGMTGCTAPAIDGQGDQVQVDQFAELTCKLEPGLIPAEVR